MIHYTNCPVCGSTNFREILQAKDYTVSGKVFRISHCDMCQHRFTNPIPSQDEIGPYYKSENYVSHTNTSKGLINGLYQAVRRHTLKRKRNLIRRMTGKEKGSLLDVGCGVGAFLNTMHGAGWECLGLEPDPDARSVAQSDFGIIARPTEDLFMLPEGSQDAITLWHVLEHVHQLGAYIQKLKVLMKVDGVLFIAVPNYQSLDAKHYGAAWAAYDTPRHLYHFCPSSMKKLLEVNGLKLLAVKRMPFDSFYVSMLTERNTKGSMARGIWNGFRSWVLALWERERCSSLIYIIQK